MREASFSLAANDGSVKLLQGEIVRCSISHAEINFFVKNVGDAIQEHHHRGEFFEADELMIMARHMRRNSVYVDIGANVGNHALFVDKFLAPEEVILFEVNPEAIDILNINRLLNGCSSWNMRYIGYALSDKEGRVVKKLSPVDNLGGTQFIASPDGEFRSIAGDCVMANRPVDFIKIDVEGSEMAVLEGLSETIARWRPVIFVELGTYNLKQFNAWIERNAYQICETFERYPGLPNYLLKPL